MSWAVKDEAERCTSHDSSRQRQQPLNRHLIPRLFHLGGRLFELHHLLVALSYRVLERSRTLVRTFVGLQVVNLHVDAEFVRRRKIRFHAWPHFR